METITLLALFSTAIITYDGDLITHLVISGKTINGKHKRLSTLKKWMIENDYKEVL